MKTSDTSDSDTLSPAVTQPASYPRSVLFICNQNTIRSPMAKTLLERTSARRIFVDSVGLMAGYADHFTLAVLKEFYPKSQIEHRPRSLDQVAFEDFELIIALTRESKDLLSEKGIPHEYWPIPEPGGTEGTRHDIMARYRDIRGKIESHISKRFGFPQKT